MSSQAATPTLSLQPSPSDMKRSLARQATCGLALLFFAIGHAWAGSFQVGPVTATLSANHKVTALTVRNDSRPCPAYRNPTGGPCGIVRSEERRVGKECGSTGRSRWSADH